jgi:hypothetical protein
LQSLIADLPALPAGIVPRAGWQQRVLAAIDAGETEPAEPDSTDAAAPVPAIDSAPAPAIDSSPARAIDSAPAPAIDSAPAPAIDSSPARAIDSVPAKRTSAGRRWAAATAGIAMVAAAASVVMWPRTPALAVLVFEDGPTDQVNRGPGDKRGVRGELDGPGELRVYDAAGVEQARCSETGPDCSIDRSGKRTTLRLTISPRGPGLLHAVLFTSPLGSSGGWARDLEAAERAGIAVITRDLQVR